MFLSPGLKQRLLPLCAFLGTFTTVMIILIFSTDIKGRRYGRMHFNLSHSDLENAMQNDPQLLDYIRENFIKSPSKLDHSGIGSEEFPNKQKDYSLFLQSRIADISGKKSSGVFIETGAYRHGAESQTEWLEMERGWRGLLTQPDPSDYNILQEKAHLRPRSHIANVCLSPTANPKQVSFRTSSANSSVSMNLKTVQCFPLYSLMLAYGTRDIEFLSLDAEKAEYEVLRTLPFRKVTIKAIQIRLSNELSESDNFEFSRISTFLSHQGYRYDDILSQPKHKIFISSLKKSALFSLKI